MLSRRQQQTEDEPENNQTGKLTIVRPDSPYAVFSTVCHRIRVIHNPYLPVGPVLCPRQYAQGEAAVHLHGYAAKTFNETLLYVQIIAPKRIDTASNSELLRAVMGVPFKMCLSHQATQFILRILGKLARYPGLRSVLYSKYLWFLHENGNKESASNKFSPSVVDPIINEAKNVLTAVLRSPYLDNARRCPLSCYLFLDSCCRACDTLAPRYDSIAFWIGTQIIKKQLSVFCHPGYLAQVGEAILPWILNTCWHLLIRFLHSYQCNILEQVFTYQREFDLGEFCGKSGLTGNIVRDLVKFSTEAFNIGNSSSFNGLIRKMLLFSPKTAIGEVEEIISMLYSERARCNSEQHPLKKLLETVDQRLWALGKYCEELKKDSHSGNGFLSYLGKLKKREGTDSHLPFHCFRYHVEAWMKMRRI